MGETVNRAYPLPDPDHPQRADAARIAAALAAIDADVAAILVALGTKAAADDIGPAIAAAIDALVAGAPAALDTLAEIAVKLADQDNAVAALVGTIATKASQTDLDALAVVVGTKANAGNVYSRGYLDAAFAAEEAARAAAVSSLGSAVAQQLADEIATARRKAIAMAVAL